MELNKHLDPWEISRGIEKEIVGVNEEWAKQMISKIRLEKQISGVSEASLSEIAIFEGLSDDARKLEEKDRTEFLGSLSDEDRSIFKKVLEQRSNEKTLEQMENNLKEYEDYIEVAKNLKEEVEKLVLTR